ncbi:DUF5777 family beta-barrel protein [Deminuibacter soli]|uniref:DUF5777 domain-containing protein n=1 Tax=Deminuibacter soli TaxID=2291815 RepID=A0A3E1NMI3_9BACT|nr:DUF5777 family beta-barrel protein [Deminuibacter soli]RFM29044.1 hypothetical protein DXN05_09790 [Deminuibacter soli]
MSKYYLLLCLPLLVLAQRAAAQDSSMLRLLNDSLDVNAGPQKVTGTFKATQIVNTPTIESPARHSLQFIIMHRFGKLNQGAYELFGLDNASIRFGLDYGLSDRLSVGIGRSSVDKAFDGNIKYKLLQQNDKNMPFSASIYGLITNYTQRYTDKPYLNARYRTGYTTELLLARKFTRALSLQLTPGWTHLNLVGTPEDKNDIFTLGIGGRMKITRRMSINAEYNWLPKNQVVSVDVHPSLSLGLDIETGGHVFQLVFSNSEGMVGPYYLTKTTGQWKNGDIFFGFNISRAFNWKKK